MMYRVKNQAFPLMPVVIFRIKKEDAFVIVVSCFWDIARFRPGHEERKMPNANSTQRHKTLAMLLHTPIKQSHPFLILY
jgi:hypothetical protein